MFHYENIVVIIDDYRQIDGNMAKYGLIKNLEIYFRWQELDMEIAAYPEFQRDDFVVVAQPILMNLRIPLASDGYTDMTYLSSDCFHITQKTNARCKFPKNFLKIDLLTNS